MADIPIQGTWVQLTHAGAAAGSWHHVREYDPESGAIRLDCPEPDIGWAVNGAATWGVAQASVRPQADLCRACGFRTAFVVAVEPLTAAVR